MTLRYALISERAKSSYAGCWGAIVGRVPSGDLLEFDHGLMVYKAIHFFDYEIERRSSKRPSSMGKAHRAERREEGQ